MTPVSRIFTAQRFDSSDDVDYVGRTDAVQALRKPEWTSEGYLKTEAFLARPGIYLYREDGREVREFVPPEVLHSDESLGSLALKAITLEHPPSMLDSSTTADYQIGAVGERIDVHPDGRVRASILVTDENALEEARGWQEQDLVLGTSPGYRVRVDTTPGEDPTYGRYDRKQISRTYNHLALTTTPRGGDGVHFRMDGVPNATPLDNQEPPVELIDLLMKHFPEMTRADAQRMLDEGPALLERADAFAALPEIDEEAEKARRSEERKERRRLDTLAGEFDLEEIDALDNLELKAAILAAAGVEELKLDSAERGVVVEAQFAAFEAFRKDSAEAPDEDSAEAPDEGDDDEGARFDAEVEFTFPTTSPWRK